MPLPITGYGIGIGPEGDTGIPPSGTRSSTCIADLVPANSRPISLHPGAVVVGTNHNSAGNAPIGKLPHV